MPTLEFTIELVKNPDTFTTPERITVATSSDIFVSFLTLKSNIIKLLLLPHMGYLEANESLEYNFKKFKFEKVKQFPVEEKKQET